MRDFVIRAAGAATLSLRASLLVLTLLAASACHGDSVSPPPAPYFRFSVDGQTYEMESIPGGVVADQSLDGKTVEVVGLNWPGFGIATQVSVRINDFHGFGTYSIDGIAPGGNYAYVVVTRDAGATQLAQWITRSTQSGSLTISSYDADKRRISGSFSFTADLYEGTGNPTVQISGATFSGRVNVQ